MKALLVDHSGKEPIMKTGEYETPVPGDHDLLVKIEATALNRADLLQKKGHYPPPKGASPILGLEMAGTVETAGSEVTRFEPGDRVFGLLTGGGYAEYCILHERMAMHIPVEFSFEEAAAIPEAFLTAFQALKLLGKITPNEHVLIHAGGSGVGTAAIQLAKHLFNANVVTTAGRDSKLKLCKELGADLTINYKEEEFDEVIESTFGKNRIDLIIDFVGSPYWHKNIRVLAMDGRLIYLSMLGGTNVQKADLVPLLRKRLTVRGSTLRNRPEEYKMRLTSDFHSYVMERMEEGKIRPVIDSIFDWEDAEQAHERMAENQNIGKIILSGM
ncbi:MAG: NAD(P)H-quinone oxidoreductase [Balneolaceae bacterium]